MTEAITPSILKAPSAARLTGDGRYLELKLSRKTTIRNFGLFVSDSESRLIEDTHTVYVIGCHCNHLSKPISVVAAGALFMGSNIHTHMMDMMRMFLATRRCQLNYY